jgi:hypothetical protein
MPRKRLIKYQLMHQALARMLIFPPDDWLCGPFGAAAMLIASELKLRVDPKTVGWQIHEIIWNFQAYRSVYPRNATVFKRNNSLWMCFGLVRVVDVLDRLRIDRKLYQNKKIADILGYEFIRIGSKIVLPECDEE